MSSIFTELESIYSKIKKESYNNGELIYKPDDIAQKYYYKISRYSVNANNIIYRPYELNLQVYQGLFDYIESTSLECNLRIDSMSEMQDEVYQGLIIDNTNKYLMNTPIELRELMIGNDLTPLGLLALRFNKFYSDKKFREIVEDKFVSIYFDWDQDLKCCILKPEYHNFDPDEFYTYLRLAKKLGDKLVMRYTFNWN
jgi:hypothetical protein